MRTSRPQLSGTYGMVASTHWLASASGMAVLERGGNAFDAAVAAGFVLQVVEPEMNGPGGDLVLIMKSAGRDPQVLCGQGPAPAAATIQHYRAAGLGVVPGTGLLAATVPGATPAWLTLLRDYGTMSPADVLSYAIGYAQGGFPISDRACGAIGAMAEVFATAWPTSARVWGTRVPAPGSLVRNPDLAATYRLLLDNRGDQADRCAFALRAWTGRIAEAVEAFVTAPVADSSGSPHAGVLTADDLAGWSPSYEPTLSTRWRGHTMHKPGGWSQGPVFAEILALIDPLLDGGFDETDPDLIHRIVESVKLAMADRDAWLGDTDDALDPELLLNSEFLASRRSLIGDVASLELRPGHPAGRTPRLPPLPDAVETGIFGTGEPTLARPRGDTCHLDVADRWGNVISATPSGGWLQSSPVVAGLGFALGTRLQMSWLKPGLASSLTPGRRPRTTLSPSLAVADDGRATAFGTPGGDQQDQWPLAFWLRHVLQGVDLQAAIEAPAWHTTSLISSFDPRVVDAGGLVMEDRVARSVSDALAARGHRVHRVDGWSLGRISAVSYDPGSGVLHAAANPRGALGYAVGR